MLRVPEELGGLLPVQAPAQEYEESKRLQAHGYDRLDATFVA